MNYLLTGEQMKAIDEYSIGKVGIPSVVLMERAALAVTDCILRRVQETTQCSSTIAATGYTKVLCVCGKGNNGADGLAVARQIHEKGILVDVLVVGAKEQVGTKEFELQKQILKKIGIKFRNNVHFCEYTFIVDAIFGIGLTRAVKGAYAEVIEQINEERITNTSQNIISVDVPSGIHAADGKVMEHAVKADMTVTFGYQKSGLVFYPGAEYAGEVVVADIGFAPLLKEWIKCYAFTYTEDDLRRIPIRNADSNKGNYGKVLLIAGSENMGGAACLSAAAAYRCGCGLVKVLTHENNRNALLGHVPEAVLSVYDDTTDVEILVEKEMKWATCVVIGPGLSMSEVSKRIVGTFLEQMSKRLEIQAVIDADALNILASDPQLTNQLRQLALTDAGLQRIMMTPHMGEMSRLTRMKIDAIKNDKVSNAVKLAKDYGVVCVLKDARTVVSDGEHVYINTSGNCGMATAGSGDVLTGIMAGMLITGMDSMSAACMAVYLHGKAGDTAASQFGNYSMKAGDIIEGIPAALNK